MSDSRLVDIPPLTGTRVVEAVCGPRVAHIDIECTMTKARANFTRLDLRSGLQKAIRRQNFDLADKCLILYVHMCHTDKNSVTWLFNWLVMAALEDCAHDPIAFLKAYELWHHANNRSGQKIVTFAEIVMVVKYLTSHGTNRRGPWARAFFQKHSFKSKHKTIIQQIEQGLNARDISVVGLMQMDLVSAPEFLNIMRTHIMIECPECRDYLQKLVTFCQLRFASNSVQPNKSADYDLVMRLIALNYLQIDKIHCLMDMGLELERERIDFDGIGTTDRYGPKTLLDKLPFFVTDNRTSFSTQDEFIANPVIHSQTELEWAHVYFEHNKVDSAKIARQMVFLKAGLVDDADVLVDHGATLRRSQRATSPQRATAPLLQHAVASHDTGSDDDYDSELDNWLDNVLKQSHERGEFTWTPPNFAIWSNMPKILDEHSLMVTSRNLGVTNSMKMPTFITKFKTFVKIIGAEGGDSARKAAYIEKCYNLMNVLQLQHLPCAAWRVVISNGLLHRLGTTSQYETWRRRLAGRGADNNCWVIATPVIKGKISWLTQNNIQCVNMDILLKMLLVRRLVQASDVCGSNFVVSDHALLTLDFNVKPITSTTFRAFIAHFGSEKIRENIMQYLAVQTNDMAVFMDRVDTVAKGLGLSLDISFNRNLLAVEDKLPFNIPFTLQGDLVDDSDQNLVDDDIEHVQRSRSNTSEHKSQLNHKAVADTNDNGKKKKKKMRCVDLLYGIE